MNRRGLSFDLDNRPWYGYSEGADNLNFSVPFFISSDGYGVLFDNPSRGHVDLGKTKKMEWQTTFSSGELNMYIIPGKNTAEILKKYHLLTGFQGLPPRWVLGNFMSRFGYTSEKQVQEISQQMKDAKIPFDAIIYDLFWFGDSIKGTMGNLDWVNTTQWPNPQKMISDFKKDNIKTVLITEPFVLKSSLNYENSKHLHAVDSLNQPYVLQDFYFGEGGLIDLFRRDAKDWFWQKHDAQNNIGVDAWWGDLGEPEKHPKDMYHNLNDMGHKRLFSSDEIHNIYGHYWTKMLYENYAQKYPNVRLFSLNRSGFAGSQRYSIFPWSGDVHRSWSGLRAQLPIMLGMSMSGIPYMHSDAGGFAMGEGDVELYLRWLQMSIFTPILRPHGSALGEMDKAAFSFPSEPALMPEPYKSWAKEAIEIRYRMLPYNYTLAYEHSTLGRPLVAPVFYDYPQSFQDFDNIYLWGKNILVAPVLEKNLKHMDIRLPDESNWYLVDFLQKKSISQHKSSASLSLNSNNIPIFVKEGSFIPMSHHNGMTSDDYKTDSLWLQYYYSEKPSKFTLFDDDGIDKKALENNAFELLTFTAKSSKKSTQMSIYSNGGTYDKQPQQRNIHIQILGSESFKYAIVKIGKSKRTISLEGQQTINVNFNKKPIKVKFVK